ncbi:MAG TPA: MiaB/RimO family radical SAM methylthiotransferase [Gemmatimonadaceae bacterium]|nr:MiaB/RimO family radical SAM methylthiotransferase [Gemmatimonadaceae bacterium]
MKVFLRTYGCRANQYDTEALRQMIAGSSTFEETYDAGDADVAIFNSCTVTAAAEADLRRDIRAASRTNRGLRTIVMGCAAAVPSRDERSFPLATLPSVEALVSGGDIDAVASAIGLDRVPGTARSFQAGARALLRIQDGCDEHCTFCATTISRGANRSRSADDIVAEAAELAHVHPEIVVTGIHIGSYGKDIGLSLSSLVERLVVKVPNSRFRLTSIEATEVDDRLRELLSDAEGRVAPHLHAPLQSGSNSVLKRMGRHWYTAESYEAAALRIANGRSRFALSADVITGFPGETEADHAATVGMVERLPFTSIHVFPYSPRPGTAALRLGSHVSGSDARRRARELRGLGERKARAYSSSRTGGCCDVVVTERGKGLTEDYLSVAVPEKVPRRARFSGVLREDGDHQLIAIPNP